MESPTKRHFKSSNNIPNLNGRNTCATTMIYLIHSKMINDVVSLLSFYRWFVWRLFLIPRHTTPFYLRLVFLRSFFSFHFTLNSHWCWKHGYYHVSTALNLTLPRYFWSNIAQSNSGKRNLFHLKYGSHRCCLFCAFSSLSLFIHSFILRTVLHKYISCSYTL